MDIETAKQLLKRYMPGHMEFVKKAQEAERYYRNETDILKKGAVRQKECEDPLHYADNRIPSNFHALLVDQEAAHLFTDPPLFDVNEEGDDSTDKRVKKLLGGKFAKFCKSLCVRASNCSVAWAHVWKDKEGNVQYAAMDSKQIIPIWTNDLNCKLQSVIRSYSEVTENGKTYDVVEIWTDTECAVYRRRGGYRTLDELPRFSIAATGEQTNIHRHEYGFVPFVPFFNNEEKLNDLNGIKDLIDSYDKVFSGFLNDIEDVQEVVTVLKGYGGTDLDELMQDMRAWKAIKLDEGGDVSTLTIQIPVEARKEMLTMTRKEIFERGRGIDPDPQHFGNSSGAALRHLYGLLELKSGLKEAEFRAGFDDLIYKLGKLVGIEIWEIRQTWTRNMVDNDLELADIATKSADVISNETILRRHPWVEDPATEIKRLEKQRAAELDPYNGVLQKVKHGGGEPNADEEE